MESMKKAKGNIGKMFRTSGTRHGAYSVGLTVIVIAIIIVINLLAGLIPEDFRNIHVT